MNHGRRVPYLPALQLPGVPDADLLARWAADRDEAAFELLVRRHAPVVMAACRRLLADPNDADDAAQAAFLVLARKAVSVARGEVLGAWLHRVACRAALRVRADRARRADRHEPGAVEQLPAPVPADPAWGELLSVLDEEVERLPARHRVAFVLCCLEGKTGEEAGKLLGCPPGTVSSRLTRARERLRARLARRGFAPALALAALTGDALAAPTSNALVASVLRAASSFSSLLSGPPTRAAAIAEGVLKTMLVHKLALVAGLIVAGVLAAGAVLAGAGADRDGVPPRPAAGFAGGGNAPADEKRAADEKRPADPERLPPAPVVRLAVPQAGAVDRLHTRRSVAEAGLAVRLFPATAGTLRPVAVRVGDRVKAGQVLAEIDAPGLALDERLAAAGVEQADGLLKEAEARVAAAKAEAAAASGAVRLRQAEVAGAKAGLDSRKRALDRVKELAQKGTVGQGEVAEAEGQVRAAEGLIDAAAVGVENAKADVAVKDARTALAEAGVATAKANVRVAQIGLERSRLAVAQARITAPFDGVIAESHARPGEFVRVPGERADPAPVFALVRTDALRLVTWVPEWEAGRVEPGQAAEVAFDALPGVTAAGRVAAVGVTTDRQSGVRVEIDAPNPKGAVRPGMTASVTVALGKGAAGVLRVPAEAVVTWTRGEQRAWAVYVYKNGKAVRTPVRVGVVNEREAEVLSGLAADDRVVADPRKLTPQAEVAVEAEKAAPPK